MNKKELYESIMKNVSKEVKKAINEDFSHISVKPYPPYNTERYVHPKDKAEHPCIWGLEISDKRNLISWGPASDEVFEKLRKVLLDNDVSLREGMLLVEALAYFVMNELD